MKLVDEQGIAEMLGLSHSHDRKVRARRGIPGSARKFGALRESTYVNAGA